MLRSRAIMCILQAYIIVIILDLPLLKAVEQVPLLVRAPSANKPKLSVGMPRKSLCIVQ